MEYFKVYDKQIFSYEMDYHGHYPPARFFRMLNGGFYGAMGKVGLRYVDVKSKINATHMVGMLDMHILEDVQVLYDVQDVSLYALPISRTKGVFMNRVYMVADNKPIAMLDGVAMVVSMETRKVMPTQEVVERMGIQMADPVAKAPARLVMPEDMALRREFTVRYSECDINKHLNTSRYIDYICETLGFWEGRQKRMTRLQVEFNKECVPDDVLGIYVKATETGYYVKGVKQTGEQAFKSYCEIIEVEHV